MFCCPCAARPGGLRRWREWGALFCAGQPTPDPHRPPHSNARQRTCPVHLVNEFYSYF